LSQKIKNKNNKRPSLICSNLKYPKGYKTLIFILKTALNEFGSNEFGSKQAKVSIFKSR
jgi:hypothetical protein